MMRRMSGKVVHFEIPADDLDRARVFYREAFGWQLTEMPEMSYTMVKTVATDGNGMPTELGAINGGMMSRAAPVTGPVITIDVPDIDAALSTVKSLGGTVVQGRQTVGDMGYTAYVADTEGNTIGLWQNRS